ncbi:MAG TPA: hypothetical protein VLS89_03480, partial [Candidatus Nanopelagicales bacterium]|nr:hypothetical protein [Candidatus Nanopelagicales bacterium]
MNPREAPPPRRAGRRPATATPLPRPLGLLAFQHLGRVLLHAILVGAAAGLAGSLFFAVLELGERHILEGLTGYRPLRAWGEAVLPVF